MSTSFGRDCWPHKRQDLFDDLKRLFLNVPSDHVLVFFFNQLDYDLCTLAVSLMFFPCCARDAITIMLTTSML